MQCPVLRDHLAECLALQTGNRGPERKDLGEGGFLRQPGWGLRAPSELSACGVSRLLGGPPGLSRRSPGRLGRLSSPPDTQGPQQGGDGCDFLRPHGHGGWEREEGSQFLGPIPAEHPSAVTGSLHLALKKLACACMGRGQRGGRRGCKCCGRRWGRMHSCFPYI